MASQFQRQRPVDRNCWLNSPHLLLAPFFILRHRIRFTDFSWRFRCASFLRIDSFLLFFFLSFSFSFFFWYLYKKRLLNYNTLLSLIISSVYNRRILPREYWQNQRAKWINSFHFQSPILCAIIFIQTDWKMKLGEMFFNCDFCKCFFN